MSRYEVKGLQKSHLIIVGWDKPLQTYFIQVKDLLAEDVDDNMILWAGCTMHEIDTVERLEVLGHDYAIIPNNIIRKLRFERGS